LRASGESYEKNQGAAFHLDSPSQSWLRAVGLFVAVGISYFLAARVGVVLGVSQGVPIFWPAAGIAVGAFITLGPNARLPVAIAVVAATIASGILIGRSLSLTITFAFFNTGEALLTAWLIERWFGRAFTLETVRQVLGFVVASAVSEAIAASGAGIVVHFLVEPTTSSAHAWRLWFASCSLGIFTVAPLLIGLGDILRELPPRRELIEGTVGLASLVALSVFVISLPQSPWATALPVALVLPVILWIAVRCRPAFAAAAMFIVALAVIWSTTFDVGHFADASVPHSDRILAAQTLVLAAALLALVLAALFAERRRTEAVLKQGSERLRLALDGAELGAFSADFATDRFECDARAAQIHGHNVRPENLKEVRRFVHPDDIARMEAALAEAQRTGGVWNAEYRVVPPPNHPHTGETRWVAVESSIMRDLQGAPVGLLGVTRDITERKRAEEARKILNAELDHRVKNALATVTAVISQTRRRNGSVADFAVALDGRIRSMATTHEMLSCHQWQGVSLMELVLRELAPYATHNNTEINGPPVLLKPEAGRAIAMVLHELATNAAKYGALSSKNGRVAIRWDQYLNGHPRSHLVFEWQEIGGPPVIAIGESSYGTSTIRDLVPYEFGGRVDLVLAREGVRCRLELPSDWVGNDRQAFSEIGAHAPPPIGEA
jgi:PAS domain S-box-containing protein